MVKEKGAWLRAENMQGFLTEFSFASQRCVIIKLELLTFLVLPRLIILMLQISSDSIYFLTKDIWDWNSLVRYSSWKWILFLTFL